MERTMDLFTNLILFLCVGFAASSGFAWLFRTLQDPELSERVDIPESVRHGAALVLLIPAGAFVLAREALDAQNRGEWPDSYVAGAYALSAVWSLVVGFAVTQIVIG
jgi:hypothetical protein